MFGGAFGTPRESVDLPSLNTEVEKSSHRFSGLGQGEIPYQLSAGNQQTAPRFQPPAVRKNSVPADLASVPLPQLPGPLPAKQTHVEQSNPVHPAPMQTNEIQPQAGFKIDELAKSISQIPSRDFIAVSDTARLAAVSGVADPQILRPPHHPNSEVPQESKSALVEHFSTTRSKHVQNRFVNPKGQPTLADRVLALERGSSAMGDVEAPNHPKPESAVQQASYESKVDSLATSILISEPILAGAGSATDSETQVDQSQRQIASANQTMNMSTQEPALPRLRVTPQVEARAHEHINYGESLARRNSYLAAREEFTLALLLIARSHKTPSDPDIYSKRLGQGLTALDEAADFVDQNHQWSQQGVLQQKVLSHRTKLISPDEIGNSSRTKALDLYCGFAQSQIELAIGYSAAGSKALYTLGKIETRSSANNRRDDWTGQARALVFFRAAMSCNPANAACANDLGVLLHDMGRLNEAEQVLKVSLASSPTRSAWANLAAVHSQLAVNARDVQERDRQLYLAKLAAMRAQQSADGGTGNGVVGQQWATMNEFHNNAAFPNITTQRAPRSRQQTSSQRDVPTAKTLLQKVKGWY